MSDLAAAAAAMGVPEALVKRSAEARAKATGASVDDILAAWAGGAPAPTAAPSAADQGDAGPQTPDAGEEPAGPENDSVQTKAGTPEPAAPPLESAPPGVLRPAASVSAPPVLVGERQGVGVIMAGSFGLLVLSLLLSAFLPSMPQPANGIRSSNHSYSTQAREGKDLYLSQGCGTCHTQLIRNVVPDVGLGPVSLDDTNQVIGYRRIGPDLAAIGGRIEDTAGLMALLAGERNHPAVTGLTDADLINLLAYLRESR